MVNYNVVQNILNTLPIGYYLGRAITVTLSTGMDSYFNPAKDEIVIGYQAIEMAFNNLAKSTYKINEHSEEELIRGILYHEISHVILTPKDLKSYDSRYADQINIFEDERIETIFKKYYMNTNFKKNVIIFNDYHKGDSPRNALEAFYFIVRFHVGPKNYVNRVAQIIRNYRSVNAATDSYWRYCDAIIDLWKDVKDDWNNNQEQFQQQPQQNNQQSQDQNEQQSQSSQNSDSQDQNEQQSQSQNSSSDENEENNENTQGSSSNSDDTEDSDDTQEDANANSDDSQNDDSQDDADSEDSDNQSGNGESEDSNESDSDDTEDADSENAEDSDEKSNDDASSISEKNSHKAGKEDADNTDSDESNETEEEPDDFESMTDEEIEELIDDLKVNIEEAIKQLIDEALKETVNSYYDPQLGVKLQQIINMKLKEKNKNGSAINSYSGRFNVRAVGQRDDYKWWAQQNREGHIRQYSKVHFNLFIDNSGSFSDNDDNMNTFIQALNRICTKDFDFDVITINTRICEWKDTKSRTFQSGGGTRLPLQVGEVIKKHTQPRANNYNIVLFDGDADPERDRSGNAFKFFDTPNTIIVTDDDNEEYICGFNKMRKVVTGNYCEKFIDEVLKLLEKAM